MLRKALTKLGWRFAKWRARKLAKSAGKSLAQPLQALPRLARSLARPFQRLPRLGPQLVKETSNGQILDQEARAALQSMTAKDPALEQKLREAYGYAVVPNLGKATLLVGGAYGVGEVFKRGELLGYAGLMQITLGVQLGGQTCKQLVLFDSPEALERLERSKAGFAANASAAVVSAGAAASAGKASTRVLIQSEGGMMVEAAIGLQRWLFKPARPEQHPPGPSGAEPATVH